MIPRTWAFELSHMESLLLAMLKRSCNPLADTPVIRNLL